MSVVRVLTVEELLVERKRLMAKLLAPPTWEQVEADARNWSLTTTQRGLYDSIKSIDWLLGEDGDDEEEGR